MKNSRRERKLLAEVQLSPFAWELREMLRERGSYQGPATALLELLNSRAQSVTKSGKDWPLTPQQTGVLLRHYREGLRVAGVHLEYKRNGLRGRLWRIQQQDAP